MNILITSASRKVSLVRAFQSALSKEGGGRVIAVDTSPLAPALYFADAYFLVPPSHDPEFIPAILSLCRRYNVVLLVPTRDEELSLFAGHKPEFADADIWVHVPDLPVVQVCQDKQRFIEFCQDKGFAVPKTYDKVGSWQPDDFPLFVKPRVGKGGRRTFSVQSGEELEKALQEMPTAVVQEFVQAPEYTIDLFADLSGKVISVVPRERVRVFGGESFVGRTCMNEILIREAVRLARALGLVGHNTIQCFLYGDLVEFIEVNPRFGGGAHLGFVAGAPTPLFLVRLLKGEAVEPQIGEFKDNYMMLRYTDDLFVEAESLADRVSG